MNRILSSSHLNRPLVTRYDELREFLQIAISLLAIDSAHGITLVFLNPPIPGHAQYIFYGIHSWSQAAPLLSYQPNGCTPLIVRYQEQYERIKDKITEEGVLFFIATDGEPSDHKDYYEKPITGSSGKYLCQLIKDRWYPDKFIVNFLLCTDNDLEVACYDKLDVEAIGVDVTDDYDTERRQVQRAHRYRPFTFSDYVVKALVGGASSKFDKMDEQSHCRCMVQ